MRASCCLPNLGHHRIRPCSTLIVEGDPEESPTVTSEFSTVHRLEVGSDLHSLPGVDVRACTLAVRDAVSKHDLSVVKDETEES